MKKMCFLLMLFFTTLIQAQVILSATQPSQLLDFSANMPPSAGTTVSSAFSGAGFEPDPLITGRLNSNAWSFTGWSDGNLNFGGSRITASTDYTRGTTANAVSTGGLYAFTGSPATIANPILLIQPGGGDWAPGSMILRVINSSPVIIQSITIQYDLYVRNDQGRSSSFVFSYSADGVNFSSVPLLDYISPVAADAAGLVHIDATPSRTTVISGLTLAPGALYYLRWSSEDIAGSGSRDEFGIDNILVTADFAQSPLPVSLIDLKANTENGNNRISWKTASELNNLGFDLQRSADGLRFETIRFVFSQATLGNSQDILSYTCLDEHPQGITWIYRLKQIDIDGRYSYSPVVICRTSVLSLLQIDRIYPLPFETNLNIELSASRSVKVILKMHDVSGRMIRQQELEVKAGVNKLALSELNMGKGYCWMFFYSAEGVLLEKKLLSRK